jgi:hypothetical protein
METLVRWSVLGTPVLVLAIGAAIPIAASAQTDPSAAQAPTGAASESRRWIAIGAASTTLRGDCQEDCEVEGDYLHSGSLFGNVGYRVNNQMDAGLEVFWVPATSEAGGDDIRTTFLMGVAQFRPWASRGFFLKAGMGMAFVRNFVYDGSGTLPPVTSKALGLTYGAGWVFRHRERISLQVLGTQHVAALGDFETGGVTVENVVGNFWSIGAGVVIR